MQGLRADTRKLVGGQGKPRRPASATRLEFHWGFERGASVSRKAQIQPLIANVAHHPAPYRGNHDPDRRVLLRNIVSPVQPDASWPSVELATTLRHVAVLAMGSAPARDTRRKGSAKQQSRPELPSNCPEHLRFLESQLSACSPQRLLNLVRCLRIHASLARVELCTQLLDDFVDPLFLNIMEVGDLRQAFQQFLAAIPESPVPDAGPLAIFVLNVLMRYFCGESWSR